MSVDGLALSLLLAGHLLGDFVLQSGRMASSKQRPLILLGHLGAIGFAHALLFAPFASWTGATVVVAVTAAHGLIDWLKPRLYPARAAAAAATDRALEVLFVDQLAHLASLAGVYWLFRNDLGLALRLPVTMVPVVQDAAVLFSLYLFNVFTGAVIVRDTLRRFSLADDMEHGIPGSGAFIGKLERLLLAALVLFGEWGAAGLVLAAKSIARFRELQSRRFSEYYLIGTLTSVLIAVLSAWLAARLLPR